MPSPMILLYTKDVQQREKLSAVCSQLQIRVREVLPSEYSLTIAALAGDEPAADAAYSGDAFEDDMLVMAHFKEPLLNAFLNMLRVRKLRPIPLKAVMTPTNAQWDSVCLHDMIRREHEAMSRRRKGNA